MGVNSYSLAERGNVSLNRGCIGFDLEPAMNEEIASTANGLIRCLQALAEESESLGMMATTVALNEAIRVCRLETLCDVAYPLRPTATKPLH